MSAFLIDKFEAHVAKDPRKPMLIFEDSVYTYEFIDQQANRVANMMRQLGLKADDTVAMMIHNEPAFLWTMLGEKVILFLMYALMVLNMHFSECAIEPVCGCLSADGWMSYQFSFLSGRHSTTKAVSRHLNNAKSVPHYVIQEYISRMRFFFLHLLEFLIPIR